MTLALLFLWFMATAQQPSPPAASDLGVIKGTVVDLDGKPVEGARVYVGGVRANVEGHNDPPLNSRENETTTNANGDFVLDQVRPGKNVAIHAYTDTDYYMFVMWAFNRPSKLEMPEVEVKPGQTVTGVIVRPIQRAGQLHLYVRDAKTKGLVHGIFFRLCCEDHPTEGGYCIGGSGPSDYAQPVPVGVGISIEVSADTHGQSNYQWQYRDPKTGSRYFSAKSGETETMNINLRQKK